jgi:topoisomerase IA-like protein
MELRQIVSVTGLGGLYQLVSSKSDGAIVRNIENGVTKFVSARLHNFTPLDSIEVYTTAENVKLTEVFLALEQNKATIPTLQGAKDADLKAYLKKIYPNLDDVRVYNSDIKKMIKWFVMLSEKNVNFSGEAPAAITEAATAAVVAETAATEEAPKAKKTTKKAAATDDASAEEAAKPKKKAAPKKTAE